MPDSTTFSTRSNAKRGAEKAIRDGTAPSIDYKLHTREDGRIEIVWQTGVTPAQADAIDAQIATERLSAIEAGEPAIPLAQLEQEIAEATIEADKRHDPEADSEADEELAAYNGFGPDPWPPGARVRVALGKRRTRLGTVDYQADHSHWRVFLDGGVPVSNLYRSDQLSDPGDDALAPEPAKKERRARLLTAGRPSKSAELDAAAARGIMPEKPIMTSKANAHVYQPRFDKLAELAAAGDWEAVRKYEVKGINSYAKMVKQYRDRLLAAHAASTAGASEAA